MEKQAAQNIQDAFLNSTRREKVNVIVHLLPGSTLSGRIKSFDKFSVMLDVGGQDVLIFNTLFPQFLKNEGPSQIK